jgi:hypothetical protein
MAKAGRPQRLTCPACGTVGSFRASDALVCKVCGTPVGAAGPPAGQAPPPPPSVPRQMPRGEPPTALAAISLACGILAFLTLWVTPVSVLLFVAALACGIAALARHEDDTGVQVMAGIGVGLAILALILTWWAWMLFGFDDGGSSVEFSSSGETQDSGSGGGNGGGGSGGDGGGGGSGGQGGGDGGSGGDDTGASDGGSGASDSGGGGEIGVDAGGDVESPMPVALLSGLGLLAAAAWRRRA